MISRARNLLIDTIVIAITVVAAFLFIRNDDEDIDEDERDVKIGFVNQIPDFEALISGFQPRQSELSYEAEDADMILSIGTGHNIAAQTTIAEKTYLSDLRSIRADKKIRTMHYTMQM